MMSHVAFDTLAFANKLKAAGAEPKLAEIQAEAIAEILAHLVDDQLTTKKDVEIVKRDTEILGVQINAMDSKLTWLVSLFGIISILLGLFNLSHTIHP